MIGKTTESLSLSLYINNIYIYIYITYIYNITYIYIYILHIYIYTCWYWQTAWDVPIESHWYELPYVDTVDGCEILHHQKDGWNPINNGIHHLSSGAGFRNHPQYHWPTSMSPRCLVWCFWSTSPCIWCVFCAKPGPPTTDSEALWRAHASVLESDNGLPQRWPWVFVEHDDYHVVN